MAEVTLYASGVAREIAEDGTHYWWLNGNIHKEDGPAVVYTDGCMMWYVHGETHRTDGPAIEWEDGENNWYLDNIHYDTFGKWLAANNYISDQEKVMLTLLWA
jgi:hypothetical protein